MQQVDPSATFLALDEIPFRRGSGFRFGDEELTANQPLPFGNPTNMSEQLKSVPGAGTTERQEEWTVKSLCVEFVDNEFKLSRRKKAWLVQSVERIIDDGWNCTLEEQFAEWAPDDFVMKFEMPRIFFPDQMSRSGYWYELAAYITDLLSPRDEEGKWGYLKRREEMHDALDNAAVL